MLNLGKFSSAWSESNHKADQRKRFTRFEHSKSVAPSEDSKKLTRFDHNRLREPCEVEAREKPQPKPQMEEFDAAPSVEPEVNLGEHLHSEVPISLETLRNALPMRFAETDAS